MEQNYVTVTLCIENLLARKAKKEFLYRVAGASTPYKRWSKCTMKKIGGKVFAGT